MMKKIKFSIIVPVYNVEAYIEECVYSVKNQTYNNWELILVNDGSTDKTMEICQRLREEDTRIKLYNQENQGVAQARNVGIYKSTGDYITFIDGDDAWNADVLDILEKKITETEEIDVWLAEKYTLSLPTGEQKVVERENGFANKSMLVSEEVVRYVLNSKLSVCLAFVKRELIAKKNIYFEPKARLGEDADWMLQVCFKCSKASFIDDAYYVYNYNREGSAMTEKKQEVCMSYLEVVKKWIEISLKEESQLVNMVTRKLAMNCAGYINYVNDFSKENKETWRVFVINYKMYNYLDNKECSIWKHFDNKVYFNIYIWIKAMRRKIPTFVRKVINAIIK